MKDQKGLLEHHFTHLKGLGDDIEAGIKNQFLPLRLKCFQFSFCNNLQRKVNSALFYIEVNSYDKFKIYL